MRKTTWMLAGAIAALPVAPARAADADAIEQGAKQVGWARWQGRLSLVTATDPWRLGVEGPAARLRSASLMGDYYFGRSLIWPNRIGGVRATSGLIFGPRASLGADGAVLGSLPTGNSFSIGSRSVGRQPLPVGSDLSGDSTTLPYVGIGYTGLSQRSGWGFSADLGLVPKSPSGLSRAGGGPTLDDLVRDLRMTPIVQLGVSYAF